MSDMPNPPRLLDVPFTARATTDGRRLAETSAALREEIPEYPLRQRTRPGITGWAQIRQAYDTCLEDARNKVRLDLEYLQRRNLLEVLLEYLQRRNLLEDIKIMVKTVPVLLFRRGGW